MTSLNNTKIENYQKAKVFLDDAKLLLKHQRFNSAISRAYYALYQFSIYILAQHGETRKDDKWSHYGIQRVLEQKNIIINRINVKNILFVSYQARVKVDYKKDKTIIPEQALGIIDEISNIIN